MKRKNKTRTLYGTVPVHGTCKNEEFVFYPVSDKEASWEQAILTGFYPLWKPVG
ncbi:hypothetical protein GUA89_26805 [Escherichia coli]|jgi:hypothetical protein|nr:hypothetical protein [Escherichia coli]